MESLRLGISCELFHVHTEVSLWSSHQALVVNPSILSILKIPKACQKLVAKILNISLFF